MITDSFDTSKPIITPSNFYKKPDHLCDTCLVTFSKKVFQHVMSTFKGTVITCKDWVGCDCPIFVFETEGLKLGIYLTHMGAPSAAMDLLAAQVYTGASNYIVFGSAGSLNQEATQGKYVIPTQSYRDEGLSYHYAPAADFIDIKNSDFIADVFKSFDIPYVQGRIWTTDAIYMETENLFLKHQKEGCIAVDMETSGLQAVCDYHGYNLYCFLETGDVLNTSFYDKANLAKANHQLDKLYVALELAKRISK